MKWIGKRFTTVKKIKEIPPKKKIPRQTARDQENDEIKLGQMNRFKRCIVSRDVLITITF